jgi:DNA-directed RNA polymerase specialized sigma24 family protein
MVHRHANMAVQPRDNDAPGWEATARAASIYAQVRQLEENAKALRRRLEQEVAEAEAYGISHEQIADALAVSRTRVDQLILAATAPVKPRRSRDS